MAAAAVVVVSRHTQNSLLALFKADLRCVREIGHRLLHDLLGVGLRQHEHHCHPVAGGDRCKRPTYWSILSCQFRATTEIVHLDVSALDKMTRLPVLGLTAADFTILEDGQPQPMVAFSAVDVPPATPPTARWMREVPVDVATNQYDGRRLVTIVIDDATVGGVLATRKSALAAARKVVDDLGPTDVGAVVYSFQNRRGQDFTTDRAKLRAAIDRLSSGVERTHQRGP